MKGKPLWKRAWFWIFVVCSIGVTFVLWPSSRPIVGRWVRTGDGSEETGYIFSKFGHFELFGASPGFFGTYRLEGSNMVILEIKEVAVIIDGERQAKSIDDQLLESMFPPVKLWMNEAGDELYSEVDPWTGSRNTYRKDYGFPDW